MMRTTTTTKKGTLHEPVRDTTKKQRDVEINYAFYRFAVQLHDTWIHYFLFLGTDINPCVS